ncbi:hypothetical protein [Alicyclobacillus tolerans]|uniref:Uncharacterized protein n=1 Tax=Alicyclobacillus tolerans TaxID=90970 RepID=A0A1M6TS76_9BACL|nr:hypothetical protein [Alicyclobacillus montanus]SHK59668.1 hypothetical protein SAMN05443507_11756 [Alicyclobacillus montanus]
MGRYKELFVNYEIMTKDEIAAHQAGLTASGRSTQGAKDKGSQDKLGCMFRYSNKYREIWQENLNNNRFVIYHLTHENEIRNELSVGLSVKEYALASNVLRKVNLLRFLGLEVGRGKNFDCPLIPENIASVNYDDDGNWKYFSRNREYTVCYTFGIIDLMQLFYDLNYYDAVDKLCEMLLITVEEAQWRYAQKGKYASNLADIRDADTVWTIRYPDLYKYIKRHLYLLEEVNQIGAANILTESESIAGESVFFSSTRHISERLRSRGVSKDHTMVCKLVNMFASLGLVEKVYTDQPPIDLSLMEKAKTHKFTVTIYRIPAMTTEVLMEANRRAALLKKAGIKATGITMDNLGKALGAEVVDAVYGDGDRKDIIHGIKRIRTIYRQMCGDMDDLFDESNFPF